ncbi:esterase/lipase family protein [Collimonas pratensis]|uniref:PGAP1-like family protein n=1 Tax=Collimonas pratensis TaxID=279113 RepID=A0A127Q5R7_9BURK|nr:hypothetical protein [Collimonas pratensis]AMP04982.1 PGAP1-like family protein [Collimonas pratensis]
MSEPVLPEATRRLTLQFDQNGEPTYATVCSPKSFKSRSLAVVPPRHVIPVIFVPGVMGTNLCGNENAKTPNAPAWRPPNGTLAGLGEVRRRIRQQPKDRQMQMIPETTKVDASGKISIPKGIDTLTEEEARRRGWGEIHWDSYGKILTELERSLNDLYINPGVENPTPMKVWDLAKTLKKGKSGKEEDILKVWNPIKGDASPLTDDEFTRMNDYYYPVWACGYNWLESNEKSAQLLVKRIKEALDWYSSTKYFIPEGKVIVLTHSMGGMVTRRASQLIEGQILGVVNSVQPVGGAPVVYRRFRAGTEVGGMFDIEGAALSTIIGWDAADITCVMANSSGPMELLPTKHYPSKWLRMERQGDSTGESPQTPDPSDVFAKSMQKDRHPLFSLPISNPYSEIYARTAQEVWWGMIDETLIDPADVAKDRKITPIKMHRTALKDAENFHDTVELHCHPNTYAHYGADAKQDSFGSVHWVTSADIPSDVREGLTGLTSREWNKTGKAAVGSENDGITFKLENKVKPQNDDDPNAGDATVPYLSAALVGEEATHVFKMKGFDHAASYKSDDVIENVLYCLGKIIQGAIPAKDLPQNKGETCPAPAAAPASDSPESDSQSSPASAS